MKSAFAYVSLAALALLTVAACSTANIPEGKKCGVKPNEQCPSGYKCVSDKCTKMGGDGGPSIDGPKPPTDGKDAPTDSPSMETLPPIDGPASETQPPDQVAVTIQRSGSGSITGTGVSCTDATCVIMVDSGSSLELTASPAADSNFASWAGCTSTSAAICTLSNITASAQVTATFALKSANFVIAKDGNGAGAVTASWAGGGTLECGAACSAMIPANTVVTLMAMPAAGSTVAWGAPCTGSGACMVTTAAAGTTVKATFTLSKVPVTIVHTGNGSITGPGALNCTSASCPVQLDYGESITLTAVPAADSNFASWTGCTSTNGVTCTVSGVTAATQVSATFALKTANFVISKDGNGSGTVTATWAGGGTLSCGAACSAMIPTNTVVTLTATPATGSTVAWGAPCTGSGACMVTTSATGTTVKATFTLSKVTVTVAHSGNGSIMGTGVNCTAASCPVQLDYGGSITLTAIPAADSNFASWTGCTSTNGATCTLSAVTAATQVTTTFALKTSNFVISKDGNGAGTVTASWAGGGALSCGTGCSATIPTNTVVTLTATPAAGSTVAWGAPCTGNGACMVTTGTTGTTIKATFTLSQVTLTVAHGGNGSVTGPGVNCTASSCPVPLNYGDSITLTAVAAADSNFVSWTGCTTTSTTSCTVTALKGAATVTATFALKTASFTVNKTGNGSGTVTGSWAGGGSLSCGATCSATVPIGTVVTLAGTPATGSNLAWGAPCSGSGSCTVTVGANGTTLDAAFTLKQYGLTVSVSGPGTAAGGGIVGCAGTCSAQVDHGSTVQIVATPNPSTGQFVSWSGCSSVTGTTCTLSNVTAAASVAAQFKLKNGADCGTGTECASNVCSSFKCCNRLCNGPCDDGCGTGTCAIKPNKTYCDTITGVGGPGSGSDILQYCVNGTCTTPTITCPAQAGDVTCPLATKQCCFINDGSFQHKTACAAASSCYGPDVGDFYHGYSCNGAKDCPTGNVCCRQHPNTGYSGYWASCVQTCDANYPFYGEIIP